MVDKGKHCIVSDGEVVAELMTCFLMLELHAVLFSCEQVAQ